VENTEAAAAAAEAAEASTGKSDRVETQAVGETEKS
jgi:hypothetical protein